MCDNRPRVNHPSLSPSLIWVTGRADLSVGTLNSRLVCQQTALSPTTVSGVTITLLTIWAAVCYSACAHAFVACSSAPVVHGSFVKWQPPGTCILNKGYVIIAFELDKLFTVLWDSSQCCQLTSANSNVSHILPVTTCTTTSRADASHGFYSRCRDLWLSRNSSLATHVTIHTERCHASFTINLNNIITWITSAWFYTATGLKHYFCQ